MFDEAVWRSCESLKEAIKQSREYADYQRAKEELQKNPELAQQVDEFRRLNYELQNSDNSDYAYERNDEIEALFAGFRKENTAVDFLNAELALCRMLQEINYTMAEIIDFDLK